MLDMLSILGLVFAILSDRSETWTNKARRCANTCGLTDFDEAGAGCLKPVTWDKGRTL